MTYPIKPIEYYEAKSIDENRSFCLLRIPNQLGWRTVQSHMPRSLSWNQNAGGRRRIDFLPSLKVLYSLSWGSFYLLDPETGYQLNQDGYIDITEEMQQDSIGTVEKYKVLLNFYGGSHISLLNLITFCSAPAEGSVVHVELEREFAEWLSRHVSDQFSPVRLENIQAICKDTAFVEQMARKIGRDYGTRYNNWRLCTILNYDGAHDIPIVQSLRDYASQNKIIIFKLKTEESRDAA